MWAFLFMEVWKQITDFINYEVSNLGNVRRKKCVITTSKGFKCNYKENNLKQELSKGYNRVTLSQNSNTKRFLVHRLVALHFISNEFNKQYVNHINGIKIDNSSANLEWCTSSENERHSYDVLNKINANRKLTQEQVAYIRLNAVKGTNKKNSGNIDELASMLDVNRTTILNVLKRLYYV